MTLVCLPRGYCPDCGRWLHSITFRQGALIRHGGYGADRREYWRYCSWCQWAIQESVSEHRPAAEHEHNPDHCGCDADILCLCPCQECRDYNTDPSDIDGQEAGQ